MTDNVKVESKPWDNLPFGTITHKILDKARESLDLPKGVLVTDDPYRHRPKTLAELILELGEEGIVVSFIPEENLTTKIRIYDRSNINQMVEMFVSNPEAEQARFDLLSHTLEHMRQALRGPKASKTRAPEEQIEGRAKRGRWTAWTDEKGDVQLRHPLTYLDEPPPPYK